MKKIKLVPYNVIEGETYLVDSSIVIDSSDFVGLPYQEGKITFTFVNCRFRKLEIENNVDTPTDISIQFVDCFIRQINVEKFVTTNFSIIFSNSILAGRIDNSNLLSVSINNCLLVGSLFLQKINQVAILYTEENIFPIKWRKLLKSISTPLSKLQDENHPYFIYDCKEVLFAVVEKSNEKPGLYENPYANKRENKFGYYLTTEEKKKLKISLNINYSADKEHKKTSIINAKLLYLSISGFSTGELSIENSEIDNLYFRNLTVKSGANLYNIKPFRAETKDTKLEICKSNLDKFEFNNISFDAYSIISLYLNKFGQTTITACDFPRELKEFRKIYTVENIHELDKKDKNYFKIRYETFLQLKKQLEASGNFHEAQVFQAVSNEALRNTEGLSSWDKTILCINNISNSHGISIKRPFVGLLACSIGFYILYLWSLGKMFNSNSVDLSLVGYYFSFLDITHRTDFLVSQTKLNGFSVTFDSLGKIFIGFFIYQFVAAFRKYGKK